MNKYNIKDSLRKVLSANKIPEAYYHWEVIQKMQYA